MSSAYPPGGQVIRRCFRCGMPLPPNGAICGNCGAYNALPQNEWGQVVQGQAYGQAPVSAPPPQPSQFHPTPLAPAVARMPAPNQSAYANSLMNGVGTGNAYYQGMQGPQGTQGWATGFAPDNFVSYDYFKVEQEKRGPGRIGMMILIGLLLLLVIGGGLTGVMYFSSQNQATPSATPTIAITTPTIQPLFRDTFTNNSTGWLVTTGPGKFSAKVGGGLMTLEDDDNKLLWDILPGKTFSDFRLDVDARLTRGDQNNAYGVYIRGASTATSDIGTYYRLELYGDGTFAIFKGTQDSTGNTQNNRVAYQANAAIYKLGHINHITVIAKGSTIVFMVNGVTIYTYPDTSYRGGLVAMFVSNLPGLAPGAQATFANLAIFPAS